MKQIAILVALAGLILASSQPVVAQTRQQSGQQLKSLTEEVKGLRKEIQELKDGQIAIQKQLQDLLRGRQAAAPAQPAEPQNVVVSIDGAPVKGEKNAKLTIVEFSDYQCPFCRQHFAQTMPQLTDEYVKTGKVRYVFRDFPLETIHPQAFKAAEAAHCAGEQGKYWEMHDRLFGNQGALGRPDLSKHAEAVGADVAAFDQCLDGGKFASRVRDELAAGAKFGVNGTPTFFLGLTEGDGSKIKSARVIRGAGSYAAMKAAIDAVLADAK